MLTIRYLAKNRNNNQQEERQDIMNCLATKRPFHIVKTFCD